MNNSTDFYQSKFIYYRTMNTLAVIFSVIAEMTYFISDCQLFNRFAKETLIPRCSIIILLFLFLILNKATKNYKIIIPASYIVIHAIMWSTIWAIYYLPIKTHASEGFIIMHLMFLAIGFAAPKKMSVFFHSLLIGNILISNQFNHYENLDIMLSLSIPCLIAIEAMLWFSETSFKEQYITKEKLKQSLLLDQLTSVYNRHQIENIIIKNTNNLLFDKAIIGILDIDFFKKVNDTYGHEPGDKILINVANIIKKNVREEDYVIRWGGEEFLMILPNCQIENANKIFERVRIEIEDYKNEICPITVSIGYTTYNGNDYHKTIKKADNALYYSKQHGRNQVTKYSPNLNNVLK